MPPKYDITDQLQTHLTSGIFDNGTEGKLSADSLSLSPVDFDGIDPAHCFDKLSNPLAKSVSSLSVRWSCIVWRRKDMCLFRVRETEKKTYVNNFSRFCFIILS